MLATPFICHLFKSRALIEMIKIRFKIILVLTSFNMQQKVSSKKLQRALISLMLHKMNSMGFYAAGYIARDPKMGVEPCPYFHWWRLRVGPLHPTNSTNQNHTSSKLWGGWGGGGWGEGGTGFRHAFRTPQRRLQECVTRWHQNTEGTKSIYMAAAGMTFKTSLPKYSNSGCMFLLLLKT